MALALVEAGARAVYCVDLAKDPSPEFTKVREYASRLSGKGGEGRLEYISGDVTDQVGQRRRLARTRTDMTSMRSIGRDVEDWRVHR